MKSVMKQIIAIGILGLLASCKSPSRTEAQPQIKTLKEEVQALATMTLEETKKPLGKLLRDYDQGSVDPKFYPLKNQAFALLTSETFIPVLKKKRSEVDSSLVPPKFSGPFYFSKPFVFVTSSNKQKNAVYMYFENEDAYLQAYMFEKGTSETWADGGLPFVDELPSFSTDDQVVSDALDSVKARFNAYMVEAKAS